MSDSAHPENKTILQRVTQILVGGKKHEAKAEAAVAQPAAPVESDEKREERLAAYRKLCEEDAQKNAGNETETQKKIKYRARDFNASESHAKSKAV